MLASTDVVGSRKSARLRRHAYRRCKALTRGFSSLQRKRTLIEQWFSALTRRALRAGDFTSRDNLDAKITAFTVRHNRTARPYRWRYDADAEHARYLTGCVSFGGT